MICCCHAQFYTNEYFVPNSFSANGGNFLFPLSLEIKIDEVDHPSCLSYHGEFLGVLRSNLRSFDIRDALLCMASVVQLARLNCYSRYRGFLSIVDKSFTYYFL